MSCFKSFAGSSPAIGKEYECPSQVLIHDLKLLWRAIFLGAGAVYCQNFEVEGRIETAQCNTV